MPTNTSLTPSEATTPDQFDVVEIVRLCLPVAILRSWKNFAYSLHSWGNSDSHRQPVDTREHLSLGTLVISVSITGAQVFTALPHLGPSALVEAALADDWYQSLVINKSVTHQSQMQIRFENSSFDVNLAIEVLYVDSTEPDRYGQLSRPYSTI